MRHCLSLYNQPKEFAYLWYNVKNVCITITTWVPYYNIKFHKNQTKWFTVFKWADSKTPKTSRIKFVNLTKN